MKTHTASVLRYLVSLGAGIVVLLGVATASAEELRIGTASQGGAFYPVGQAISTLVGKHVKGTTMVPIVTEGSVQNPRLVGSGEVDVGITNNNLAALANKGAGPYKSGAMDLRALGPLHPSVLHMMVLANSPINSIADLKGKRIAVGPAGGGTIPFLKQVLSLAGLTLDDITPSYVSYQDGFSQLSDGIVDAAFALSGYPAGAVLQAKAGAKLKYIPLSADEMAKVLKQQPAYGSFTIPAAVYGTDADGTVLGVLNVLVVKSDMDETTAYNIAKAVYGNLEELAAENAVGKQVDLAKSAKLSIPLHPGAERFFKE